MSNNLKRKLERKKKLLKRKNAKKELAKKLKGLFLPDECSSCKTEFNKKSKDMAMSWHVTVREESVRLFCPNCWQKARDVINEYHGGGGHNGENSERD